VSQSVEAKSKAARDAWLRALANTAKIGERGEILPQVIDRLALQFGPAPALIGPQSSLNFSELAARARQYTRFALSQGLRPGETAALCMSSSAEYVAAWLGLSRAGCGVALLNTQLSGEILSHSLGIARPKLIVADETLAPRLSALRDRDRVPCFVTGASFTGLEPLEDLLARQSSEPLEVAECAIPRLDAAALYIYTSGTTGLPKGAQVSHYRLMQWSHWFAGMMDTKPSDRLFNCLPLYHSVGGVVAVFAPLLNGGSVVIRPRFSASAFWPEVCAHGCTLFQYIGELCRYLVNSPQQPLEAEHSLRLACGNGLRIDVWEKFQQRFRIPHILEYYAATEGNFSLYNCEEQVGAIGRIPPFLASRLRVALLRFDLSAGEPMRNAEGRCEACGFNEVGEAVGLIPEGDLGPGRFEGYLDAHASELKILRDVFVPGDAWYRTGDLMRRDERGFFYFVDRIGETYRWKGENVSTQEVCALLTAIPGVREAVVYGVAVPGSDGRAGMAALVADAEFDLGLFRARIAARLPPYARPVFLRLVASLDATATFKPRTQQLIAQGFEPAGDPVYLDDVDAECYVPLDDARLTLIRAGAMRF
jgi:fatty-acyl-CoA synthase